MAKRTPSLETLSTLLSEEDIDCVESLFDSDELLCDAVFVPNDSASECEIQKQRFSTVRTFIKNITSPRKTKVTTMAKPSQESNGKGVDDGKGPVVTRIFDRNRFSHTSNPLGSYLNVPLPPGFIPPEIIVPVGVFQDDVKFERFLKHRFVQDGIQRAMDIKSSTYTVKSHSSRRMTSTFQIPSEDHSLPSTGSNYTNKYTARKGKRYGTARSRLPGATNMPKDQPVNQRSDIVCLVSDDRRFPASKNTIQEKLRISDQDLRVENVSVSRARRKAKHAGENQMDKESGCVEPQVSQRWATPCLKLPDSDEHTCGIGDKWSFCLESATEEAQYERRALERFLSRECSEHRRSAICEEIENMKQIAKVNGFKLNLRLLREDLACVKTLDPEAK